MTLSRAELLKYIDELKRSRRNGKFVDTNRIEDDFLNFSQYQTSNKLRVVVPKLYDVKKTGTDRLVIGAKVLGIDYNNGFKVDISGAFHGCPLDVMIFLNLEQASADHLSHERSYLNPLIEKIYSDGGKVISDFSVHEPIYGKVHCKRGDLDLNELAIFPEKFHPGNYEISIDLDTPKKTLTQFRDLSSLLDQIKENPVLVKDFKKIEDITSKAVSLRELLGSLSRYDIPKQSLFSTTTNSCLTRNGETTLFHLYSPKEERNSIVYFGNSPLMDIPRGLDLFDGKGKQEVLSKLIEADFYIASQPVLYQRIQDISKFYDSASKIANRKLADSESDFGRLIDKLKILEGSLDSIANEESRKKFVLEQPKELLEFMVCPANNDPVLHDLLPHISWNKNLREYHDTPNFIKNFSEADSKTKEDMLSGVISGLNFSNQNNNDINLWLYENHADFCKEKGIDFEVIKN